MALTTWTNVITGKQLDEEELQAARESAYEANTHLFEDESEALSAFGVMPVLEALRRAIAAPTLMLAAG